MRLRHGKSAKWLVFGVALLAGVVVASRSMTTSLAPATPNTDTSAHAPPTNEFDGEQEHSYIGKLITPETSAAPSNIQVSVQNAIADATPREDINTLSQPTDTDTQHVSERPSALNSAQLTTDTNAVDRRDAPPTPPQRSSETDARQAQLLSSITQLTDADSAARASAVTTLWEVAADLGVPPEALVALETAAQDRDPAVAELAQRALNDLTALQQNDTAHSAAAVAIQIDTAMQMRQEPPPEELAPPPAGRPAAPQQGRSAHFEQLAVQAINHPDAEQRLEAITSLAQWRDVEPAIIINTLVHAARDPDAGNRYNAITVLARLAPDITDRDGSIVAALTEATNDGDAAVADIATIALQDLSKLHSTR